MLCRRACSSLLVNCIRQLKFLGNQQQRSQLHRTAVVRFFGDKDKDEMKARKQRPSDFRKTASGDHINTRDIVVAQKLFDGEDKDSDAFISKVEDYTHSMKKQRTGHSEFIYGSMKVMKEFGVHKDLEAYKALMDVFPKKRMKPQNIIQAGFWHFNKQQQCALHLLDKMEYYRVMPDAEMEQLVISIFSKHSFVWRKVARQLYWMSKFKNASPFPLPEKIPEDGLELAKIALKRMCIDLQTKIGVFSTGQISDSLDKTWIVSAQSPSQKELIAEMKEGRPVYVEGAYQVYVDDKQITYFVLRADTPPETFADEEKGDPNDVTNIPINVFGKSSRDALMGQRNLHIQRDGTMLAICATGTSSRDSLLSWIRLMENLNPNLRNLQVIFTTRVPETSLVSVNDDNKDAKSEYERGLGEFKRIEENEY